MTARFTFLQNSFSNNKITVSVDNPFYFLSGIKPNYLSPEIFYPYYGDNVYF